MRIFHLVAGPSAVGKALVYEHVIRARAPRLPLVQEAAFASCLQQEEPFALACTFGLRRHVALIEQARAAGWQVALYALGTDAPGELSPALMANYRFAVRLVDLAFLFDQPAGSKDAPWLAASLWGSQYRMLGARTPRWIDAVFAPLQRCAPREPRRERA